MRIGLMLRNLDDRGGVGVYTRELLQALLDQDSRNEYLLFHADSGALGRYAGYPNVTEIALPSRSKLLWDQWHVPRRANRLGLDLLFSPKMAVPLAFLGRRMFMIHGAEQFLFAGEYPAIDRLYVRTVLPLLAQVADHVLVGTQQAVSDAARGLRVAEDKVSAIHLGARDLFSSPLPEAERREVCARYGLPPRFLLYVGLIWGAKNFDVLPDVLERVAGPHSLVLAHAGSPRPGMRVRYPESPHIRRLGFVPDDDLKALYQSAVALVFPSLYEGFGVPLVEAMASGCPVITSDWGAMKEVCGSGALLVDSRDPAAIAAAVTRLVEEPGLRAELVARGHARARELTWANTARRTLERFGQVVASPPVPAHATSWAARLATSIATLLAA